MTSDEIRALIAEGRKHDAYLREPPAKSACERTVQLARKQASADWMSNNLGPLLDLVDQLRAKAAKLEQERDAELARNAVLYEQLQDERSLVADAGGVITELRGEIERATLLPVAVAPLPEREAEVRAQLAAINRASQQLHLETAHEHEDAAPAGGAMSADVAEVIAALEAELAKARRAVAFFTTPAEDGFDWEGWLEGRIEGPPPEVGRHERIVELEAALRGLVARVDRAGGYASPEEQDVLRRARQTLAGAGAT